MKKHYAVVITLLLVLFIGCSMMENKTEKSIVGIWTGKGLQGSEVTLIFKEDMTMTMSFDMGDNEFTMNGKYTADLSKNPAVIDLLDIEFPQGDMTFCCMAIAEFPTEGKMNICGLFGQSGEVIRPTEFNRNPSEREQLYLELMKKE